MDSPRHTVSEHILTSIENIAIEVSTVADYTVHTYIDVD